MTQKQKLPTKIKRVSGETVMFQHSVTVLCIRLPYLPTRRAFPAFGALSVLLWFRLLHKAPKSTNTLLFRAFAVGSSVLRSTKMHQNCFFEHIGFSTVSQCCVFASPVPPPPSCFWCLSCIFVIAMLSRGPESTNIMHWCIDHHAWLHSAGTQQSLTS